MPLTNCSVKQTWEFSEIPVRQSVSGNSDVKRTRTAPLRAVRPSGPPCTYQGRPGRLGALRGEAGGGTPQGAAVGRQFGRLRVLSVSSAFGSPAKEVDGFSYTALNVNF